MSSRFTFSTFDVSRQVFYHTKLSYGVVNLKPIVPGHVLVVPRRVVKRLADLTGEELTDMFDTVRRVGQVVEKAFQGESLTIALQDGPAAGQSVPHVHVHILPRRFTDFGGRNDAVYPALETNEAGLPGQLGAGAGKAADEKGRLRMDNDEREPRSMEEMEKEADWLRGLF
ncbi:HIT-like protein [Dacryopinax primogenitus]|uniref:Bis(5'-adenosyl)-triphosphatase n=1 Tax=Dacryopinax primogenitus (strain DJM 731) TaxID=1858805 RepID=M5G1Y7_DACPD|nr:HIT-like protein [Dacryopinax primogenitus]EJU02704.1 HIT-like protein [Dacryopinax primogenitus]